MRGILPVSLIFTFLAASGALPASESLDAGNMSFVLERYGEAAAAYREVAESTGEHAAAARYLVGRCLSRMEKFEEAAEAYERLIREHPESEWRVRGENALGDARSALGEWEKAIDSYRNVLRLRPDSADAMRARLNIAGVAGNPFNPDRDYDLAIDNYLRVLRGWDSVEQPDLERARVYFGIGEAFRNLGRNTEAIAYYERSRAADRSGVWGAAAQNMIGNCRLTMDQPEAAAEAYFQTAVGFPYHRAFASMAASRLELLARQGVRVRAEGASHGWKDGRRVRVLSGPVAVSGEDWEVFCGEAAWDSRERTLACREKVRFFRNGSLLLTAGELEIRVPREEVIELPAASPAGVGLMMNLEAQDRAEMLATKAR